MRFSYLCDECGNEYIDVVRVCVGEVHPSASCPFCDGTMRRAITGIQIVQGMQPHFNVSLGKPISSNAQFRSELTRKSDEMSAITGAEHRFVPVDLNDKKALGVTDEGLDTTARMRRETGLDSPTRKIIT